MGQKVNFNKKNKVANKKIIMIVAIVIILIILIVAIKKYLDVYKVNVDSNGQVDLTYNTKEYNSLADLLYSYDTELIRLDESTEATKIYVSFDRDLYTFDKSNENHFKAIINAVADYRDYVDFEIIDMIRDIEIKIVCENLNIIQITINGDNNYFLNKDSKINASKDKVPNTEFTIQSEELQACIDNKWIDKNIEFGSKDSRCNDYDIYFDEGIRYKKVNGEIFNLIFTEKYQGQVAGGLYVTSTYEEVKKALGEPTFSEYNIYGYVSENSYLFFDFTNTEISIYPVKTITKEEEETFKALINEMNKTEDLKKFATDLMDLWIDYDEYKYNQDLLDLQYTLKGIALEFSMVNLGDDGIFIYQNYSGETNIRELDNVYISEKNSVFEAEKARAFGESINRIEQGSNCEEQYEIYGKDFAIRFKGDLSSVEKGYKGPYFLSRDKSYPDSELDRTLVISSFKWYDDQRVVYSVDNEGIYMYDCISRKNVLIEEIDKEIVINEVTKNTIVYNDTLVIDIEVR